MKLLPFKKSDNHSIGVEFELQIINPKNLSLCARAKDLLRNIKESSYKKYVKPEITQSMIEINSSIHFSPNTLQRELLDIQRFLVAQGHALGVSFCGGGTHPFQRWTTQKIFPTSRYKKLSQQFKYLSKRSTVFGQHIHIGCQSPTDALYLTHALSCYVPHFIAISASSPYYQGIDTHFHSSRSTVFNAFPLSGVMPVFTDWQDFSSYFYKMRQLGIIESMKDFYWDIRPKPEFGTVEMRVCDMPLTSKKGVILAAYLQALALYLLQEKPIIVSQDLYHVYSYNRFQASRYGFDGLITHPNTLQQRLIIDDILETIHRIEHYANQLNTMGYIALLSKAALDKQNDSTQLRKCYENQPSLSQLVDTQCRTWANETTAD